MIRTFSLAETGDFARSRSEPERNKPMSDDFSRVFQALDSDRVLRSDELLPLVYDELRHLASMRMARERPGQTLQATALVHEAWLKLSGNKEHDWCDRAHFFRAAATAIRRILVDRAREKSAIKRGERAERLDIADLELVDTGRDDRVLLVDEMLERLEAEDPDSARVVSLKFFGGLTETEIARIIGVTDRTVRRQWAYAKARLFQMIQEENG
jgi:RNA polymerase sigma factor (TIGR02999 family)